MADWAQPHLHQCKPVNLPVSFLLFTGCVGPASCRLLLYWAQCWLVFGWQAAQPDRCRQPSDSYRRLMTIVYVFIYGWHVLNFSQNLAFGLVLLVIVVQVQYVTQFNKYELCCQYFCRRESSLIPNYRSGSGSHVMRNPALWLLEMESGLVVNVSDRAGYINLPRSLVGNTTFECPFEYTSEQTILPESKLSSFLPRYGVKTGQ